MKSLSYEDKRHISIIHRNFDFRSTRDFRLIEKYSSFISNWETFKNDLYSDLEKNIVCCDPLKNVVLNVINYVGCKSVMGDLLFCNRLFEGERQCNQCTRMTFFDHKHSQILSRLNLTKISSLLVYSPDITKEAISMIMSHQVDSVLFYKSFISSQIINSSRIKERQKTFYDINPLSSVTIYEFNRNIFQNLRQLFVFEDNKTLQTYIVL